MAGPIFLRQYCFNLSRRLLRRRSPRLLYLYILIMDMEAANEVAVSPSRCMNMLAHKRILIGLAASVIIVTVTVVIVVVAQPQQPNPPSETSDNSGNNDVVPRTDATTKFAKTELTTNPLAHAGDGKIAVATSNGPRTNREGFQLSTEPQQTAATQSTQNGGMPVSASAQSLESAPADTKDDFSTTVTTDIKNTTAFSTSTISQASKRAGNQAYKNEFVASTAAKLTVPASSDEQMRSSSGMTASASRTPKTSNTREVTPISPRTRTSVTSQFTSSTPPVASTSGNTTSGVNLTEKSNRAYKNNATDMQLSRPQDTPPSNNVSDEIAKTTEVDISDMTTHLASTSGTTGSDNPDITQSRANAADVPSTTRDYMASSIKPYSTSVSVVTASTRSARSTYGSDIISNSATHTDAHILNADFAALRTSTKSAENTASSNIMLGLTTSGQTEFPSSNKYSTLSDTLTQQHASSYGPNIINTATGKPGGHPAMTEFVRHNAEPRTTTERDRFSSSASHDATSYETITSEERFSQSRPMVNTEMTSKYGFDRPNTESSSQSSLLDEASTFGQHHTTSRTLPHAQTYSPQDGDFYSADPTASRLSSGLSSAESATPQQERPTSQSQIVEKADVDPRMIDSTTDVLTESLNSLTISTQAPATSTERRQKTLSPDINNTPDTNADPRNSITWPSTTKSTIMSDDKTNLNQSPTLSMNTLAIISASTNEPASTLSLNYSRTSKVLTSQTSNDNSKPFEKSTRAAPTSPPSEFRQLISASTENTTYTGDLNLSPSLSTSIATAAPTSTSSQLRHLTSSPSIGNASYQPANQTQSLNTTISTGFASSTSEPPPTSSQNLKNTKMLNLIPSPSTDISTVFSTSKNESNSISSPIISKIMTSRTTNNHTQAGHPLTNRMEPSSDKTISYPDIKMWSSSKPLSAQPQDDNFTSERPIRNMNIDERMPIFPPDIQTRQNLTSSQPPVSNPAPKLLSSSGPTVGIHGERTPSFPPNIQTTADLNSTQAMSGTSPVDETASDISSPHRIIEPTPSCSPDIRTPSDMESTHPISGTSSVNNHSSEPPSSGGRLAEPTPSFLPDIRAPLDTESTHPMSEKSPVSNHTSELLSVGRMVEPTPSFPPDIRTPSDIKSSNLVSGKSPPSNHTSELTSSVGGVAEPTPGFPPDIRTPSKTESTHPMSGTSPVSNHTPELPSSGERMVERTPSFPPDIRTPSETESTHPMSGTSPVINHIPELPSSGGRMVERTTSFPPDIRTPSDTEPTHPMSGTSPAPVNMKTASTNTLNSPMTGILLDNNVTERLPHSDQGSVKPASIQQTDIISMPTSTMHSDDSTSGNLPTANAITNQPPSDRRGIESTSILPSNTRQTAGIPNQNTTSGRQVIYSTVEPQSYTPGDIDQSAAPQARQYEMTALNPGISKSPTNKPIADLSSDLSISSRQGASETTSGSAMDLTTTMPRKSYESKLSEHQFPESPTYEPTSKATPRDQTAEYVQFSKRPIESKPESQSNTQTVRQPETKSTDLNKNAPKPQIPMRGMNLADPALSTSASYVTMEDSSLPQQTGAEQAVITSSQRDQNQPRDTILNGGNGNSRRNIANSRDNSIASDQDSVNTSTPEVPITVTASTGSNTSQDYCKEICHVYHNKHCNFILTRIHLSRNYSPALCKDFAGYLADMNDWDHIRKISEYVRSKRMNNVTKMRIRLGMTYNPNSGDLKFSDGSLASYVEIPWLSEAPRQDCANCTEVLLSINTAEGTFLLNTDEIDDTSVTVCEL